MRRLKKRVIKKGEKMKIEIIFTEPLLGTLAGNKEIAEEFIVTKHLEEHPRTDEQIKEEIEALPEEEVVQKSSTYFSRNGDEQPVLWDYQIKGFFKDACSMLNRTKKHNLQAHKKVIDGLVFVTPRQIPLQLSGDLTFTERPLRGQTAKGERISLARSETAPAGTKIQIEILLLNKDIKKFIVQWLEYGALRGLGQWRNSGMGRFNWSELKSE